MAHPSHHSRKTHLAVFAALLCAAGLLCKPATAATFETYDRAVLRGLDKVTARVTTLEAPVGAVVQFGTLQVVARTCRKTPPEELPEAAAFLEIREVRPGEPAAAVFDGWMFASSPALSAMDHAVYDIWVLDCVNTAATVESTASEGTSE